MLLKNIYISLKITLVEKDKFTTKNKNFLKRN